MATQTALWQHIRTYWASVARCNPAWQPGHAPAPQPPVDYLEDKPFLHDGSYASFLRFIRKKITIYGKIVATPPFFYACAILPSVHYKKMERWKAEFSQLLYRPQALLLDSRYFSVVGVLLILVDAVATAGIVWRIPCKLAYNYCQLLIVTANMTGVLDKWNMCVCVV